MVATGHYLASLAAHDVLEAGGNAIDAGVAAGITLAVVESFDVGFAGVAPTIVRLADRNEIVSVSGVGVWPRGMSAESMRQRFGIRIPDGILQSVIPAAPSAWITCLQRYGTLSFGDVTAAAIRHARAGYPVHSMLSDILHAQAAAIRKFPTTAAIYLPSDRPPVEGDLLVQEDLGKLLQFLADEERANVRLGREQALQRVHDAFYKGDVAQILVRHHVENGGLITSNDLAEYVTPIEQPVMTKLVGGVEAYTTPPWGQGPAMLMALSILEHASLESRGHNSAEYIHCVVEAIKLASADREVTFGDPSFVDVPLNLMLSREYTARRHELIDPSRASLTLRPGTGTALARPESGTPSAQPVRAETSVVCVVDRHRNAFVSTPSEGAGGGSIVPGLGLVPSRRGRGSVLIEGHPAEVKAGHRPRMTNGPSMFLKPGDWVMPIASPGSDNQMQAVLQVVLNTLVFDYPLQPAVEAPRVTTHSFPGSFEPHTERPGSLFVEGRVPDSVVADLRRKGHVVEWWGDWGPPSDHTDISTVCAVRAACSKGVLEGAADPRRPSMALGR